jgi:sec-independent protein translocase protein TatB
MFGIGGSEIVVIALIVLIIFGPRKLPQMARDLGRFVSEARSSVEEFKEELSSEEVKEARRDVEKFKNKPASSFGAPQQAPGGTGGGR